VPQAYNSVSSDAGADSLADLKCDSGETPLMCAVREGLGKVIEKLLVRGAIN
jgi:ankyrin repeat protein